MIGCTAEVTTVSSSKIPEFQQLMESNPVNYQAVLAAYKRDKLKYKLSEEDEEHFEKWKKRVHNRIDDNGFVQTSLDLYRSLLVHRADTSSQEQPSFDKPSIPNGTKVYYSTPNSGSAGNWKNIGPFGDPDIKWSATGNGATDYVTMHPTQPNVMYLSVRNGGLWKTENYGKNWIPMTDYFASPHVSCLGISKSAPNIMYLGAKQDELIWYSDDEGQSWENRSNGLEGEIHEILIDPIDETRAIAATRKGIYLTIDAGLNWTQKLSGVYTDIEMTDNWDALGVSIDYSNGGNVSPSFFKSIDKGNTWTSITVTTDFNLVDRVFIAFQGTGVNPTILAYIQIEGNSPTRFAGLYKSTNGGGAFNRVVHPAYAYPNGMVPLSKNLTELDDGYGGVNPYSQATWVGEFFVDPNDADHLLTMREKFWGSDNGGQTWEQRPSYGGATWADNRFCTTNTAKDTLFWCNDGGLWAIALADCFPFSGNSKVVSKNGDICIQEGTQMDVSLQNKDCHMTGGQDIGQVFQRNGKGTHVASADVYRGRICPYDDSKFITGVLNVDVNGTNYPLYNSIDADHFDSKRIYGFSKIPVNLIRSPQGQDAWNVSNFLGENVANAGGHSWTSSVSNWEIISNPVPTLEPGTFEQSWANKEIAFLADEYGEKMYKTENLSAATPTWTQLASAPASHRYRMATHPNDENLVGLVTYNTAYISRDKGVSWVSLGSFPGTFPLRVLFDKNTQEGMYVATDLTVWYKDETMSDWIEFNKGLPLQLIKDMRMVHYPDGDSRIYVTKYGRGNWYSPTYEKLVNDEVIADFSIHGNSASTINVGEYVQLYDLSMNADNLVWTIENGTDKITVHDELKPRVRLLKPGYYKVTLVATNSSNSDTKIQTDYIFVESEPNCSLVTGNAFGTSPAWGGSTSTFDKVFDGDVSTYFDYASGSGGYAGLDLGSDKNVFAVRFHPRSGNESRMVGGKIQASSTSNFLSDVEDLYTIATNPSSGWTEVEVSPTKNYRYFRYLSPVNGYCNIAELEFCAAAIEPPLVQINSPITGYSDIYLANITIEASAYSLSGNITKVEFYEGNNLIGSISNSPYNFNWNNIVDGVYSVTAKAYDNLGQISTSNVVEITIHQSKIDCNGESNGSAIVDSCGTCSGGNTGVTPVLDPLNCVATSVENKNEIQSIIYPNPNNGIFTLECSNVKPSSVSKIVVNSASGETLHEINIFKEQSSIKEHIDISNNTNGLYFIVLQFKDRTQIVIDKIILTH